jgi:hypothetical protein
MLVRLVQEKGFLWGEYVPGCHWKGPFSCSSPPMELHPGPPLRKTVISLVADGFLEGKNQKKSSLWLELLPKLVALGAVMGSLPA